MIRLAGVAAGQARRADLLAALALTASRARSASRSRSPCMESASWVVMVYMMFSFRSSPPRLAAVHTGDERAGARWTAHGKYPRSASGAGGSGAAGDAAARAAHGDFREQHGRVVTARMTRDHPPGHRAATPSWKSWPEPTPGPLPPRSSPAPCRVAPGLVPGQGPGRHPRVPGQRPDRGEAGACHLGNRVPGRPWLVTAQSGTGTVWTPQPGQAIPRRSRSGPQSISPSRPPLPGDGSSSS